MSNYLLLFKSLIKTDYEDISYICADNKVHIRLRDFDSPSILATFEDKLSYLLTYLINYSKYEVTGTQEDKKLQDFLKSEDVNIINECINNHSGSIKYKGISLHYNYRKISTFSKWGSIKEEYKIKSTKDCNLANFLNTLNITLDEYLFNDSYGLMLLNKFKSKGNTKFINKKNKKLINTNNTCDVVELW